MTEPPVTFATLLRKLRREARLTQEELAEAAALSVRAVAYLERGEVTSPQKDTSPKCAAHGALLVIAVFLAGLRQQLQPGEVDRRAGAGFLVVGGDHAEVVDPGRVAAARGCRACCRAGAGMGQ